MLTAMLRDLRAHPGRVAMTLAAIALGVATTVAAWMVGDSASTTLAAHAVRADVGVTVQQTGDTRLPERLRQRLAGRPGVTGATGISTGRAGLVGRDGKLVPSPTVPDRAGTNWTAARMRPAAGRAPARAGEVAVDAGLARTAGLRVGDRVRIVLGDGRLDRPTVTGLFRYRPLGATGWDTTPAVAYATATAAHRLRPGYDRIELTTATGADPRDVARDARDVARGYHVRVATGPEIAAAARAQVRSDVWDLRLTLLPFAAVALLVGAFVIANTFTMLMAQRVRQIGLFRAVGARAGQVRRAVLSEAAVLALIGATLGALIGVALAPAVVTLAGPEAAEVTYTGAPAGIALGYLVAVPVTLLAAYGTSRRASRVPPMAALRPVPAEARTVTRRRGAIGSGLLAVALAVTVATLRPDGANPPRIAALCGIVIGVAGVLLLTPALAAVVLRPFGRLAGRVGPAARLAVRGAARDPRRTAGTAGAITIGIGLICAFATVAATFEQLIGATTRATVPSATTVVRPAAGGDARLTPADLRTAARTPGVTASAAARDAIITVAHGPDTSIQKVTAIEPRALGTVLTPRATAGRADLRRGVLIARSLRDTLDLRLGDTLTLPLDPHAPVRVRVAGVYEATEASAGVYVDAALAPPSLRRSIAAVYVAGPDPASVRDRVRAAFRDRPDVAVSGREAVIAEQVTAQRFGFLVIYAMFGLSVLVAAFGMVNTLTLSVTERAREIAVLRALGATPRLVRRWIRLESTLIALLGAVLGATVGVTGGAVLQHAMLVQPLTAARIPYATTAITLAGAVVVATLAAALPSHTATRPRPERPT